MLLVECRRAFNGEASDWDLDHEAAALGVAAAEGGAPAGEGGAGATEVAADQERNGLEAEWAERLVAARRAADQAAENRECIDPSRLVDGLLASGAYLATAEFAALKSSDGAHLKVTHGQHSARLALLHQSHFKSVGSAIAKLTTLAERELVIVLRERAQDLPPTWKDTLAKRRALLATGRARWIWFEREDAEKLLALDSLLQAARSGDLTDARGAPLGAEAVASWVGKNLCVPTWTIVREILGEEAEVEVERELEPRAAIAPAPVLGSAPKTKTALALLRRLRVASLDRVVREVTRLDPQATRASVIAELETSPNEVRWFGRSILGLRLS
jgi:hypothetical protein